MSRTLALALGLSAIDGLMCAFVAIFALAFIMPAAEGKLPRDATATTQLVLLERTQTSGAPVRMGLQLLFDNGREKVRGTVVSTGGDSTVVWEKNAVPVKASWRECTSEQRTCSAQLVLSGLPQGATLEIRPYLADSVTKLLDESADSVQIRAKFIDPRNHAASWAGPIQLTFDADPASDRAFVLNVDKQGRSSWKGR